ncbi:hypothetical protein [Paracoccus sp. SY]|uniref:hypothetical protein n=1 Tax=Paracoccus sp. SY TaxID=1330255 RepID=UPI000CD2D34B|nr:hypothetical protein [Paracoccus sp. SY]
MSDTGAVVALFIAAMIGAGFVGQLLGEALIRFAIWRGWFSRRTIIVRTHIWDTDSERGQGDE